MSLHRVFMIVLVVLAACGSIALFWALRILIIDIVLALTLASAIAPLAEKLEKKGCSRLITVVLTYASIVIFYVGIGFFLAQPIQEQSTLFVEQLPHYTAEFKDGYGQLLAKLGDKADVLNVQAEDMRTPLLKIVSQTVDFTKGIMGLVLNGVLVLFLAAYFIVEADYIWSKLLLWLPEDKRERAYSLIKPLAIRMGGYVRGQMLVSTAVSAFFAIGLTLIGVKYGLVLGLLGGLLNLLPFVGSMITTVLALFVAANQSVLTCALTGLLFVVEQAIESNFIVPHLLGKQVDMHPLVVLLAIIVGATLAGAVGALAAVPTTAALLFLAHEFYLKPLNNKADKLGS